MADTLALALAELQADLPHIPKAARGQHGRYADLADLTRLILPRLSALGLVWVTEPTITMLFGDEMRFVLAYRLIHAGTGDDYRGWYPLGTGNPQQLGSAITYARRYCLCAVTGVAPDEDDDDAQAATDEYKALRRRPPEVDEHGAATQAEQMRMMTGPEPGLVREQGTASEVTDWNGTPTAPDEDPRVPAMRAMFALYKELGVTGRDEMLMDLTDILGRGITSRADLSLEDLTMSINPLLRSRRNEQRKQKSGRS